MLQEEFRYPERGDIGSGGYRSDHLREETSNDEDGIVTVAFRELGDQVSGDGLPGTSGNFQGFEVTNRFSRERLIPVAGVARADVGLHI